MTDPGPIVSLLAQEHAEKKALAQALEQARQRIAELEAALAEPEPERSPGDGPTP